MYLHFYLIKLFGHSGSSYHQKSHATLLALANIPPSEDNNDAIKLIKLTPFYRFMFKLNNLNQMLGLITFVVIIWFSANFVSCWCCENTLY